MAVALLSGCAKVQITDTRWYGDMGAEGAAWFDTLDTQSGTLTEAQWDPMRFGMLCTTSDVFASWKADIEKLCSVSKDCDYATQQQIKAFFARVEAFNQRRAAALRH